MERKLVQTQEVKSQNTIQQVSDNEEDFAGKTFDEHAEEASKRLIAYVEKHLAMMNDKLLFSGREPSFYELDIALSTYEQTLFSLTAIYETAKFDAEVAKEKWTAWYNEKFMEIRNQYNNKDVKSAMWLSAKEIDATIYAVHKEMAAKLRANIISKECERSTVERLLKGWESYQFILGQLSKNAIAQANASGSSVDLRRGDETDIG